jgi:hypothetical protein
VIYHFARGLVMASRIEDGNCDTDKFDCITDYADGSSVTTGEECPEMMTAMSHLKRKMIQTMSTAVRQKMTIVMKRKAVNLDQLNV